MLVLKKNKNQLWKSQLILQMKKAVCQTHRGSMAKLRLELRCSDFQPQEGHCVCAVWSSKRSSSSFNLLLSVSQKANVEETGSPLSQSPVTSHGGLMR